MKSSGQATQRVSGRARSETQVYLTPRPVFILPHLLIQGKMSHRQGLWPWALKVELGANSDSSEFILSEPQFSCLYKRGGTSGLQDPFSIPVL